MVEDDGSITPTFKLVYVKHPCVCKLSIIRWSLSVDLNWSSEELNLEQ